MNHMFYTHLVGQLFRTHKAHIERFVKIANLLRSSSSQ